jgi:hypothetical protein
VQSWFSGSGGRPGGTRAPQSAAREAGSRQAQQPLWIRYGKVAPIVVIVLLVLLFGGGALLLVSLLKPSGQILTIARPTGGTLTGAGIRCGTQGTDCVVRRPTGDTVELTPQADQGFAFRGYTGDCAPGGVMVMNGAKHCAATFEAMPSGQPVGGLTQTLTISPIPTGGTLEGLDILCGTKGSVCSANHPDGVPVELHPTADPGFTFMGFTGDCVPLGHTQMSGPRTCGATFSPTDSLKPGKEPPPVRPTGIARGGTPQPPNPTTTPTPTPTGPRGGTGSQRPTDVATVTPPPPIQPPATTQQPPKTPEEVKPPISDEEYAKNAVKQVLAEYCDAYHALDPDAVQRVYPKVNMTTLRLQLNRSRYKSVECTLKEPKYDALDAANGKAKAQVEIKHVFEHTALGDKPEVREYIATISFYRASQRGKWFIDAAEYRVKPQEK